MSTSYTKKKRDIPKALSDVHMAAVEPGGGLSLVSEMAEQLQSIQQVSDGFDFIEGAIMAAEVTAGASSTWYRRAPTSVSIKLTPSLSRTITTWSSR